MPTWQRLTEILSNSIAKEAIYSFGLMALVAILVFGYRPKLSPRRVIVFGFALALSNLAMLFVIQEKDPELYVKTVFYLAVPVIWLAIYCRHKDRSVANILAVASAGWMLVFFKTGIVASSYANALSLALVLIPIFHCWRDPKQEGFIRTSLKGWGWGLRIFGTLLAVTGLMLIFRWDGWMVSKYSHGLLALPLPLFLLFFFLVKAIPEELVFRGIFQGALKDKLGFLPAVTGSALLYGIAALNAPAPWAFPNWRAAVNAVILGLGCGVVYNKTKSLAISAIVNASVSFLWWFVFEHGGH